MLSQTTTASLKKGLTRNVVILGFVSLLNDSASEMIYPLLPVFLTAVLGATPVALGLIEGAAESAVSFLKLYSGTLSDRIRRRKSWIVAGYSLSSLVRPLIALSTSWLHVLALRVSDRIGKGIRTSPRDAMIADSTSPDTRGTAYGFHRAMDHAGAIIGPLAAMGLLIVLDNDMKSLFLLSLIPGVIAVCLLLFGLRERERPAPPSGHRINIRTALSEVPVPFRKFLIIILLFTLGNSSDAFLLLQAERLGVPVALLPVLWVVLHIVKMTSSVPAGMLSDRIGRKKIIIAGWIVYALVYAGFAVASTPQHAWVLFAAYGVFFGLTEGVEKALVADVAPAHLRGSAFGLYHLVMGIGALPASLVFGAVWQSYGAPAAFGMGATLALLAAVLLFTLRLERREDRSA